jgi:hypothetical protein
MKTKKTKKTPEMKTKPETKKPKQVEVRLMTTVDDGWIEFVTGGPEGFTDVFISNGHCGYWLAGIKHNPERGWLAYDHADEDRRSTVEEDKAAIVAWRAGKKLPKNFHALDEALAKDSWAAGVERGGVDWYEHGDGNDYDIAIQIALLGEIVYG